MHRLFIIATAIAAITLASCSGQPDDDYFPYATGQSAVYNVVVSGPTLEQPVGGQLVIRVDNTAQFRGNEYFREVWASDQFPMASGVNLYRVASDGVYFVNEGDTATGEILYTPLPVPVGSSWTATTPQNEVTRHAVLAPTIEINGQTYENCLQIASTIRSVESGDETHDTAWYVRDIGLVKRSITAASGMQMDITLARGKKR